ncbi:hypothetical protein GLOTRDRAFT_128443 [Gloeophyllum trabeum ATCC 11539]|uniref:Uncharacterized protein n=1 Tax=Gloeophyllum trabeum (strain ATCC 11539 / FP-39264 / Madison 617) TaxID=670483 RepID=S7Q9B0_GLOTA|nr:uncharacterized protein GLOTRDRAFT_128443 [Gloeophyllum trabeum ATCC 11539]EPQ56501.1 hypothetical protein GLOTRDRAFT_128443 [Gloeophyllum trabeum ATCC 11539]
MVQVTYHARLSVIAVPAIEDRPYSRQSSLRSSHSKSFSRSMVRAWKTVTRAVRSPRRASILPADFVIITAQQQAKRRSIMFH